MGGRGHKDDSSLTSLKNTTSISIGGRGHKDDSSLTSLKNTTSISIGGGGHKDDLSLTSPLKRCKFVQADSSSSINRVDSKSESRSFHRPRKGQTLEVIPFLSNNGQTKYLVRSNGDKVALDVVLGKHLGICCVSLPMLKDKSFFNSMIPAYSELSRDDFEMVLVAHVKPGFDNGEALFNAFFSGLPCLAIPFSEFQTRDNICSFIGFNLGSFYKDATAIVVHPSQTILQFKYKTLVYFYSYGSEWFPFLQSNAEAIETQDEVPRIRLDPFFYEKGFTSRTVYFEKCKREGRDIPAAVMGDPLLREPLSLHKDVLLCDPSLVLPRIGAVSAANQQLLTVSELSNKYVGLYVCTDTDFILDLIKVHHHCIANGLELVILVVCIPIHKEINSIRKEIKQRLDESLHDLAWFIFPDNSKVWRRLWRVFACTGMQDELIILPPNCKNGELKGRTVIENFMDDSDLTWIENAYPFTRSAILQRTFASLRSLTPASLFKGATKKRTCLVRNGRKVRQSVLAGKKLLLYLDWLDYPEEPCEAAHDNGELCRKLMNLYPDIKANGWEVVFAPLDTEDNGQHHAEFAVMPWPIMPLRDAAGVSVIRHMFFSGEDLCNKLVAFDEDGRIVSRQVEKRVEEARINNSLFNDTLYEEIFDYLYDLRRI